MAGTTAETAYARCGELSLAYKLFPGRGSLRILFASSFVSHVELMSADPMIRGFIEALGPMASVVMFDKAGVGLSDPVPKVRSLEDRVSEIEAVLDAVGWDHAVLMGISEGGPAATLLAATRPDRVDALILAGTFAAANVGGLADEEIAPEVLAEAFLEIYGEAYAVPPERWERLSSFFRAVRDEWGSGAALTSLLPSLGGGSKMGMLERMSASPGMVMATVLSSLRMDVRAVLPAITVPTLVVHATDDTIPFESAQYLADHIPGARLLRLEGHDHAPWLTEPDRFLAEIERFLTGAQSGGAARRALRTVLFTDVVDSTRLAAELGDATWHGRLEQIDVATRQAVARHGGAVVKSTGDGHLATLDGPAQAIACAEELRDALDPLGIEVRQGIHVGECELLGDDIGGMAVHIAARVMGQAGAGEILVSSTVRDLVVGSGIGFDDRGERELKGVPGTWRLLAVHAGGTVADEREAHLVRLATPAPSTGMRRSDRAMALLLRKAPGISQRLAKLTG